MESKVQTHPSTKLTKNPDNLKGEGSRLLVLLNWSQVTDPQTPRDGAAADLGAPGAGGVGGDACPCASAPPLGICVFNQHSTLRNSHLSNHETGGVNEGLQSLTRESSRALKA